ncbi:MAG TPA: TetR/AcrR family transcriptional regulator [Candidatus Acidoferrum sp.]|jgi:TetR/AcrR family transcriptional repressor of nem operon
MTKGEDTRREIVEKAAPLFNQKGFEGTSLSDLMRVTGLQKGGIYRHFSSKEELASEAFDYAWQKAVSRRLEGLDEATDAVERLKKMIDNFVDIRTGLVPGGCPLMNTAVEADDGNPVLRARARGALQGWMARLAKVAEYGVANGEINSRVDAKALGQLIISTLEGALLISRLENDRAPLDRVRHHLRDYLETNVRRKKTRRARA